MALGSEAIEIYGLDLKKALSIFVPFVPGIAARNVTLSKSFKKDSRFGLFELCPSAARESI